MPNTPPKVKRFPAAKQRRLDTLLQKNAEGIISAKEAAALKALVDEAEELMVANAHQLAKFAEGQSPQAHVSAVPVTVWVTPQVTQ
jgi:hypothetical protein